MHFTSWVEKSNVSGRFPHHVTITVSPKTLPSELKILYRQLATANLTVLQIIFRTAGHLLSPKAEDLQCFGDRGQIGGELY
jgi:hypothetical protein